LNNNFGSVINEHIEGLFSVLRNGALQTDPSITFVVSLTKKIFTDNEGLGFDFGEEA
jgi:hypothetical protein